LTDPSNVKQTISPNGAAPPIGGKQIQDQLAAGDNQAATLGPAITALGNNLPQGGTADMQIAQAVRVLQEHFGSDATIANVLQQIGPEEMYQPLLDQLRLMQQNWSPTALAATIGRACAAWSSEAGGPELGLLILGHLSNNLAARCQGQGEMPTFLTANFAADGTPAGTISADMASTLAGMPPRS